MMVLVFPKVKNEDGDFEISFHNWEFFGDDVFKNTFGLVANLDQAILLTDAIAN